MAGMNGSNQEQPGEYRTTSICTGSNDNYPPPSKVESLMESFINWVNSLPKQNSMHDVLMAAELHYRFESIHPFWDGNGRTGRLLMNLFLMRSGSPVISIDPTSDVIYKNLLSSISRTEVSFHFIV
jgi:Fic family protein